MHGNMKGKDGLDTSMKNNPGANRDPDMGKSIGTPKPNMKEGFSQGSLDMPQSGSEYPNITEVDEDYD